MENKIPPYEEIVKLYLKHGNAKAIAKELNLPPSVVNTAIGYLRQSGVNLPKRSRRINVDELNALIESELTKGKQC
jgi:hypothetical protein